LVEGAVGFGAAGVVEGGDFGVALFAHAGDHVPKADLVVHGDVVEAEEREDAHRFVELRPLDAIAEQQRPGDPQHFQFLQGAREFVLDGVAPPEVLKQIQRSFGLAALRARDGRDPHFLRRRPLVH